MEYALVTASSSGIGYAIAERLLQEGHFCYVNYAHDDRRAESIVKQLLNISKRLKMIKADLSSIEGISILINSIKEDDSMLNHIVLNCGVTDRTPFGEITQERWNYVLDTNVSMPFFLFQGLFDSIEDEGSIVLISSLLGRYPHAMSISYGVSKAALSALCQNLVKVCADRKVRINALEPGFVDTPWQNEKPIEQRLRIEKKIALNRFAQPYEIADMCHSVLHNTYINGALIPLCGGYDMI